MAKINPVREEIITLLKMQGFKSSSKAKEYPYKLHKNFLYFLLYNKSMIVYNEQLHLYSNPTSAQTYKKQHNTKLDLDTKLVLSILNSFELETT